MRKWLVKNIFLLVGLLDLRDRDGAVLDVIEDELVVLVGHPRIRDEPGPEKSPLQHERHIQD